jgi:hypothetical protein
MTLPIEVRSIQVLNGRTHTVSEGRELMERNVPTDHILLTVGDPGKAKTNAVAGRK